MKIKEIILSNGKTLKGVIEENGKVYYSIQAVAKSCGFSTEQAKTLKRRLLKNKLTRELLEWGTIPTTVSGQKGWKLNSENLIYLALSVPEFSLVVIEASSNCKIYRFSHTVQELGKNPYGLIFNLLKSSFEEILNEGINAIKTKENIENLSYVEVIKKYPEEIEKMNNIIIKEIFNKIYIDPEKKVESHRLYAVKHIEKDLIFLGFCSPDEAVIKDLYKQNLDSNETELIYLSAPILNFIEVRNKIRSNFVESKLERGWLEANKNEFLEFIKNEIEPNLKWRRSTMKKVKKYRLRKKNNIVITKSNNDLVYLRNLIPRVKVSTLAKVYGFEESYIRTICRNMILRKGYREGYYDEKNNDLTLHGYFLLQTICFFQNESSREILKSFKSVNDLLLKTVYKNILDK